MLPVPASRPRRAIDIAADHPWWTILAALCVATLVLVLLWDWNWFKGPVERQVTAVTGRSFTIAGDLDVDLGRVTVVSADRLSLGNSDWSTAPTMATADRLELRIEPLAWLRSRAPVLAELRLVRPDVLLETGEDGGNWDFGGDGDGNPPAIRRLWIDGGRLRFSDPGNDTSVELAVASRESRRDRAPHVAIDGDGRWRGSPFTLEGRAESPLELQDTEKRYRIDLRAVAGDTRAHARGNLVNPFALREFDLQLALAGDNLEDLFPLIGIATPPTPPYTLDGRFSRNGSLWRYDRFDGVVGDSDLGGDVAFETSGERPMLRAVLASERLDFDDLAGFIGGAPAVGEGETTNEALEALARERAAAERIFPDTDFDLARLREMDADVRWKAARVDAPGLPIESMDATLTVEDGVLRTDPLDFGIASGRLRAVVQMDAREDVIRTRAQLTLRDLALGELLPDSALANEAVGRVGGDITLEGRGNSIAAMLATSDGDVAIGMGSGRVSNLLMELAGLDIYESLKFLIGRDRQVAVRCAFGDFAVAGGTMTSRALAFDTSDTIIVGEGTVSLADETLDLELRPRPKDRSLLALRSPLVAGGTFKDPSFRPDFARLGVRGAIALALGSIAPPAALLATIDLGGGEDSGCGGEYAR